MAIVSFVAVHARDGLLEACTMTLATEPILHLLSNFIATKRGCIVPGLQSDCFAFALRLKMGIGSTVLCLQQDLMLFAGSSTVACALFGR